MISLLINQIENNEIVLPAIQRDFVWGEERIIKLFDSIMRGYPLGIVLLWETYLDIKYRAFEEDYQDTAQYKFKNNLDNKRLRIVLDGQQRLQSIYIALKGSLNGKELYFDVLSGSTGDDFKEVFYIFKFLKADDSNRFPHYVSIKSILESSPESLLRLRKDLINKYSLSDEESLRLEINMSRLVHSITNDPNVLKISTIDENKPQNSKDRKTESDILEAFVRINRQGISLSRSDLIFSMLKLSWNESAEELPEFIKLINDGNNLNIDVDFVIRSLFAVSNLGSKFDVDLLRKNSNIERVKENYVRTCNAVKSLVDFLKDECNILNSSILGGYLNLIPFVYYLAYTPNNLVPKSEIAKVRKAILVFGYTRPFSRYADNRIGRFIREELYPLVESKSISYPLESSEKWAKYWEGDFDFNSQLLQRNINLTLHLLQDRAGTSVKYGKNAPEIDHIFPQSILKQKGYDWNIINSYGNFWILAKTKNQNKSNKHPKEFFVDVDDVVLEKALIDRHKLDYSQFTTFVHEREERVLEKIKKSFGFIV